MREGSAPHLKFNMAASGWDTVQAFSFFLLLRDNDPSESFTPLTNALPKPAKYPFAHEFQNFQRWKQGGCQQEKPSYNRGI